MSRILLILTVCPAVLAAETEPQAAFVLRKGLVEVALRHDGKPVANATMEIFTENGAKFGEASTEEDGETAFFLPKGKSFVVEIKTGDRLSDPVRLYNIDGRIEPSRVLLSYGLRPCCRFNQPRQPVIFCATEEPSPTPESELLPWAIGGAVAIALAAAGLILWKTGMLFRQTPVS